nr:reverse transcriptase domain-containing protein [Tanacetum cinerariifolium]
MLKYGVTHRLSVAYHTQTSGQVEVSNRGLKTILERTIGENHASWSDKLDDALWAFHTAYKTPIRCTPYKLVYGKVFHLPIELEHEAYWALKQANFDLAIAGDHQKVQLNELNELRDHAYENSLIYKEKAKRIHDSKIKNRVFNVGDRVLLFNSRLKILSGKLKTHWSGPFTIPIVFPYGTVELSQANGPNFKVNGHRVKHYFGGNVPQLDCLDCEVFHALSFSFTRALYPQLHFGNPKAFNNACYVQNRVLVVKPYNKTSYELFHGITSTLSFMIPFGCPVTIINTIDHLGKFDGKTDEGFFVGYSLNSKAFIVFNSKTRIVEEKLHIKFSESTPNVVGSRPDWLFDINALTRTMNYEAIVASTQSNGFACTKASDNVDLKSSNDDGSKPTSDDGKKVDENPRNEIKYKDQEKEDNVYSTNNVNTVSSTINTIGTNRVNVIVADMNNLDTKIQVSLILTIRIRKDYPLDQVIGDFQSATQIRKMSKNLEEHGFVSTIQQRKIIKTFKTTCLLSFYHRKNPKG